MAWGRTTVWTQRAELITGSHRTSLIFQLQTTAKPCCRPPYCLSLGQNVGFLITHPCAASTLKFDFQLWGVFLLIHRIFQGLLLTYWNETAVDMKSFDTNPGQSDLKTSTASQSCQIYTFCQGLSCTGHAHVEAKEDSHAGSLGIILLKAVGPH